ncbi:MAG: S-methyl-5'-thioadenosine phosphorylase [Candidatus Omnitrophota bacterium]|nr:S-methyl-5'-thioadenosine phosphorylase [Candidatus Omnitrophota bacterium]
MSIVGIIGGSGLYELEGIKVQERLKLNTPFGEPSDEYILGSLEGRKVVFLSRHGAGHRISPGEINYRANIYGMKKLKVEHLISVSAVGSLKEEIKPLDIVLADQFVDRTNQARKYTFFEKGIVAHIGFGDPVCPVLRKLLFQAAGETGASVHQKGTYLNMEGPAFSTRAESFLYRSWGMDIIGMTNMAEARLAREAEMCFATVALVTDYDCWFDKTDAFEVSAGLVMENMRKNIDRAKKILIKTIPRIKGERSCDCAAALKDAIVTDKKLIPSRTKQDLEIIIGKYL